MGQERGFRQLTTWQRADELASLVLHASQRLPSHYRWLASQVARAAISVPANIAEGYGRGSKSDYLRFLDIARGSLSELEYYIHFLSKEGLIGAPEAQQLNFLREETGRLLYGLWRGLKSKASSDWDHSGLAIREDAEWRYEADD